MRRHSRHDQRFKTVLEVFFGDLLRIVVPEFADLLVPEKARPANKELFTALPEGKRREVDFLMEVPSREGEPEIVLVHVEVEARKRRTMARRLWRYSQAIHLRHPGPVIPIVVYLKGGKAGVAREVFREELWGIELSTFTYWAFALGGCKVEDFLERPEPLAWGLVGTMKVGELRPAEIRRRVFERLLDTKLAEGRRFMLAEFLDNYLQWSEEDEMAYQQMLEKPENRGVANAERSWFGRARVEGVREGRIKGIEEGRKQGRAEGREEGREEGRKEGRAEGLREGRKQGRREALRDAVLSVLERRFGEVPGPVARAVWAIESSDELNELLDRAATASDLDDVRSALGK